MKKFVRCAFCAAAVLAFSAIAKADSVDNPRYQAWAKFKIGSNSTYGSTISMNGMQVDMQFTWSLTALTDDQATIDVKTTVNIMGQPHTSSHPTIIPAKVNSDDLKDDGEEDVKAMGSYVQMQGVRHGASGNGHKRGPKNLGEFRCARRIGEVRRGLAVGSWGAAVGRAQNATTDFTLTGFEVK